MAEYVGVSTTTVMRWEKGENRPFFEEVVRLSDILEVPVSYFAGETHRNPLKTSENISLLQTLEALAKHSELIEMMIQLPENDTAMKLVEEVLRGRIKQLASQKSLVNNG